MWPRLPWPACKYHVTITYLERGCQHFHAQKWLAVAIGGKQLAHQVKKEAVASQPHQRRHQQNGIFDLAVDNEVLVLSECQSDYQTDRKHHVAVNFDPNRP